MPATAPGKAIAARNATTHGLFARDIVLPSLGEDPEGYTQVAAELTAQLCPRNLLERHYVEKIAAASWRLRRLHRWQAQIFEEETLTEDERLDKLDKVLRHETALHRQIDTAVKMLSKDVPLLYARRVREQVLEESLLSEFECRTNPREEVEVDMETQGRLRRIRNATDQAAATLDQAPLDTYPCENSQSEICQNEPAPGEPEQAVAEQETEEQTVEEWLASRAKKCQNEPNLNDSGGRTLSQTFSAPEGRCNIAARPLKAREERIGSCG